VPDAVKRNRIKRQLREHFRLHCNDLGSCDLVFMARPAAAEARSEQVREAIHTCWVQLKKHCAAH
jgi:ribonuclease P protein component